MRRLQLEEALRPLVGQLLRDVVLCRQLSGPPRHVARRYLRHPPHLLRRQDLGYGEVVPTLDRVAVVLNAQVRRQLLFDDDLHLRGHWVLGVSGALDALQLAQGCNLLELGVFPVEGIILPRNALDAGVDGHDLGLIIVVVAELRDVAPRLLGLPLSLHLRRYAKEQFISTLDLVAALSD